MPKIFLEIFDV